MPQEPLKIKDLRDLIKSGEAKDPLVFLEAVMNGQDPRKFSGIYGLILDINDLTAGDLTQGDWNEVVDYCINHAKYQSVSLADSTHAAKTLAEYLHAKRKHIEKIDGSIAGNIASQPLTEEEIELFKEKFNDDF